MFHINVHTGKEILSNPPPEFRHLNLIFTPFAIRVGQQHFPAPFWTDFAGVFLFRWYRAVWKLASDQGSSVRLPFWYTYEMRIQRTTSQLWLLSLVERELEDETLLHEAQVIPEVIEAALLSATHHLLGGAESVGIWTEDCVALDALLKGRETYLEALEAGQITPPSFLDGQVPKRLNQHELGWEFPEAWTDLQNGTDLSSLKRDDLSPSLRRWMAASPLLCPRCGGASAPWAANQSRGKCPRCGQEIRKQ